MIRTNKRQLFEIVSKGDSEKATQATIKLFTFPLTQLELILLNELILNRRKNERIE